MAKSMSQHISTLKFSNSRYLGENSISGLFSLREAMDQERSHLPNYNLPVFKKK